MKESGVRGPCGRVKVVVIVLVPCLLDVNIYACCEWVTTGMASAMCSGGGPGELCMLVISIRGLLTSILGWLGNSDVKRVLGLMLNNVTLSAGLLFSRLTSLPRQVVVVLVSIVLPLLLAVVVTRVVLCALVGTLRTPLLGTSLCLIRTPRNCCVRPVPWLLSLLGMNCLLFY